MPAFGFQIQETTGSQRGVILQGRSLPYRDGTTAWEGNQRHNLTWYPGNSQGTLQVLGPEEAPTEIQGIWKDRFLPNSVELINIPDVQASTLTAEQLVSIFDRLRRSGNTLRVQWGPFVREGILSRFRAEPDRIEDIRWVATFVWFSRDEIRTNRASEAESPTPSLRQGLNEVDDQLAFEPSTTVPTVRQQLLASTAQIRSQSVTMFDRFREIDGLIRTPLQASASISTSANSIRLSVENELELLADVPYQQTSDVDRVADLLRVQSWRFTMGRRLANYRAIAQRRAREVEQEAKPGALAIITVQADTSLRKISLDVYGTSDSWQIIADANGIVGSIAEAGTIIVVPPAPSKPGEAVRANLSA